MDKKYRKMILVLADRVTSGSHPFFLVREKVETERGVSGVVQDQGAGQELICILQRNFNMMGRFGLH